VNKPKKIFLLIFKNGGSIEELKMEIKNKFYIKNIIFVISFKKMLRSILRILF